MDEKIERRTVDWSRYGHELTIVVATCDCGLGSAIAFPVANRCVVLVCQLLGR